MKTRSIVLCDPDTYYATGLASYMMEHFSDINIHIYTNTECYFADEGEYDIGLLESSFAKVDSFKRQGKIRKKYLMCDGTEDADLMHLECIDKFSPMDEIINKITENEEKAPRLISLESGNSSVVGIYSPISHELQLPFAMAAARQYAVNEKVLFVDLEEISILSTLTGQDNSKNMLDCLYMLSTEEKGEVDLSEYINEYMGFDYIPPFIGPDEINEIGKASWKRFFESVLYMGYDKIVVLFGRAIDGFCEIISSISQLIILSRPGDFYKKSTDAFTRYLIDQDVQTDMGVVQLPMSAQNLSDGSYCTEELLMGNLGAFVQKLITESMVKTAVAYG